jgi:hypothetical protein
VSISSLQLMENRYRRLASRTQDCLHVLPHVTTSACASLQIQFIFSTADSD